MLQLCLNKNFLLKDFLNIKDKYKKKNTNTYQLGSFVLGCKMPLGNFTDKTSLQERTLTSLFKKCFLVESMPMYLPITEPHLFSIVTEVQQILLPK